MDVLFLIHEKFRDRELHSRSIFLSLSRSIKKKIIPAIIAIDRSSFTN